MENQITPNSSYPDFIRRSSLEGRIIFIFCSTLRKLNIHRLSPAYLHTMSFSSLCRWAFFFSRSPFFFLNTVLTSYLIVLLNFECLLCPGTWTLNETRRNYVKVSFPLDLCNFDIWKWDHCHVVSLSKDSNWWIFHPRSQANLSSLHTDVHCIKTLFWSVGLRIQRVRIV